MQWLISIFAFSLNFLIVYMFMLHMNRSMIWFLKKKRIHKIKKKRFKDLILLGLHNRIMKFLSSKIMLAFFVKPNYCLEFVIIFGTIESQLQRRNLPSQIIVNCMRATSIPREWKYNFVGKCKILQLLLVTRFIKE